jgi:hypothetical protein
MIDLADIGRVADAAKRYLAERKRFERISEKSCDDLTPKQMQKRNVDLGWQAVAMIKIEAELHTACVDAGLADLRDPAHYGQRTLYPDSWHKYPYTPPQPRDLVERAA